MNRIIVIIAIFLFMSTTLLHAIPEGRIPGRKRPSLLAELSLERTELTYNAPLFPYISVNFGFTVLQYNYPGLSFGPAFQWLDGEHVAGVIRSNFLFVTTRTFNHLRLGGYLDASFTAGPDVSGFMSLIRTQITGDPRGDTRLFVEGRLGIYFKPAETLSISFSPGLGKYFIHSSRIFFNFSVMMEARIWK